MAYRLYGIQCDVKREKEAKIEQERHRKCLDASLLTFAVLAPPKQGAANSEVGGVSFAYRLKPFDRIT
jgi:uncharacterized protein YggU (UPF0235/DUF167 family)